MSLGRLQGFVNRSARSDSPFTSNRNAAQGLKFLPKSTTSGVATDLVSSKLNQNYAQNLQSIEPEDSNLATTYENTYQGLGLDSVVDSDFDRTRTDSAIPEINRDFPSEIKNDGMTYLIERQLLESNVEQTQYETQNAIFPMRLNRGIRLSNEALHPFPSQQDMSSLRMVKTGRFQSMEPKDPEIRNATSTFLDNHKNCAARKNSHSENGFSDTDQGELDDDAIRFEETPLNMTPSRQKNARAEPNLYNAQADNNTHSFLPDYDDEALKKMTYAELEAQSWEDFPQKKSFTYPRELRSSGTTLETKINFYLAGAQKEKDASGPGRIAAVAFYEQLTCKEWNQAGEIFIGKFTELMQRLQEKRREKRELTQKFESTVQAREKAVQSKTMILEKKMQDMRTGGENLLVGSPKT